MLNETYRDRYINLGLCVNEKLRVKVKYISVKERQEWERYPEVIAQRRDNTTA